MSCKLFSLFAVAPLAAATTPAMLTKYLPANDISTISQLDLSQQALESALPTWATALSHYTSTSNGGGVSLASLSTGANAAMDGQTIYNRYKAYFGTNDYVNVRVTGALQDTPTGICVGQTDVNCQKEIAKKSSNYMGVWMWVIGKMEEAITTCSSSTSTSSLAWDTALAYYSGSLEGADGGANNEGGKMLYRLADKRCGNYGTCWANGTAKVNTAVVQQFRDGKDAIADSSCSSLTGIKDRIVSLMSIPLIQGAQRYAYKMTVTASATIKSAAEGDVFMSAIIPQVQDCSASAATTISNNQIFPGAMADGMAAVKGAWESVYSCLGITCADIGCLEESPGVCYEGMDACSDTSSSSATDLGMALSVAALLTFAIGYQM